MQDGTTIWIEKGTDVALEPGEYEGLRVINVKWLQRNGLDYPVPVYDFSDIRKVETEAEIND